jgi:hypothetical protein
MVRLRRVSHKVRFGGGEDQCRCEWKIACGGGASRIPAQAGFGKFVMRRIYDADLSPPFINGHPVTASTVWIIPFRSFDSPKNWLK